MTDYAGKSSTLNAVATTAHCAIDGYMSAIQASQSLYVPSISRPIRALISLLEIKVFIDLHCLRHAIAMLPL
jgi:hypothetical protein